MNTADTDARLQQYLEIYSQPKASMAALLCDQHDPDARAYRIIRTDYSSQDLTYGELRLESERFAAVLQGLGIRAGDRVATLMGKSRDYLVTLMGIWRLGAVHVPLFTAFAPPAIVFRLRGSNAKLIVCDQAQQPKLIADADADADADTDAAADSFQKINCRVITTGEPAPGMLQFHALMAAAKPGFVAAAIGGDGPIIHVYTSGTTGNPKGVVVPLRALAAFHAYADFALDLRPDHDIYWCAADPGWAYGLYFGIINSLQTGVSSVLFEGGFSPAAAFTILAQEQVTNFAAAPTIYRSLRSSGIAPPPNLVLRCASSAGEPLTPEVNEWAASALGVEVSDHYGQTEAGMLINNHHHSALKTPLKSGSMGKPMPGWRATVLDAEHDEEVGAGTLGRVAMVMADSPLAWFTGYDGNAAKTAEKFAGEGRWYLTGDMGLRDDEGYYHFSARDDDVIIMAGYRIGPFEVESVMLTHEAVSEAAIIAVPDAVRGEVMEAFVVLANGYEASAALEKSIQEWVKRRYAAHAYPRAVHFVDQLPKTPSGKVQRFVLKQQRLQALAAS
ncbi:MAG: AMP-binding protein [Agrobacterium vaccinii]